MPPVTYELIASQVDERSAARGRAYACNGAIVEGQRNGSTLRAACHGSRPEPYRVEVTFDDLGIHRAHCTCPVGTEGGCKHVAALLFVYRDDPARFPASLAANSDPPRGTDELGTDELGTDELGTDELGTDELGIDEVLEQRSQDELIDLVKRLLRRAPALIDFVLRDMTGSSAQRGEDDADNDDASPRNDNAEREHTEREHAEREHMQHGGEDDADDEGHGEDRDSDQGVESMTDLAKRFAARPGLAVYRQIRALGLSLGCWDLLRPAFDAAVSSPRHRDLRIRMHLLDGNVAGAIAALPHQIPFAQWSVVDEVARAAEATHPETARALYNQYVEALIQHRGRDNYRRACTYLERIRRVYHQLEDARAPRERSDGTATDARDASTSWQRYIAELRDRHAQLPALLDELDAAGL